MKINIYHDIFYWSQEILLWTAVEDRKQCNNNFKVQMQKQSGQTRFFFNLGVLNIVSIKNHSLFLVYGSMRFDKCIQLCSLYYSQNIEWFHHTQKFPHAPGWSNPPTIQSMGTTDLFSVPVIFIFQNII